MASIPDAMRVALLLSVLAPQRVLSMWLPWASVPGPDVRLNSVGYTPAQTKRATAVHSRFYGAPVRWRVFRCHWGAPTYGDRRFRCLADEVVLEGAWESFRLSDTGRDAFVADFSSVRNPGQYIVQLERRQFGHTVWSAPFNVTDGAFAPLLRGALDVFLLARCGVAVGPVEGPDGQTYAHGECHTHDGSVDVTHSKVIAGEGQTRSLASTGGWHDAGDYGKYTPNTALAVATLLLAHEHFGRGAHSVLGASAHAPGESHGRMPRLLEEARWGLAWLLTVQTPSGAAYHKLTAPGFASLQVMPEDDDAERFMAPVSSASTAFLAGAAAQGARAFADADPDFSRACLSAAVRAFAWVEGRVSGATLVISDQSAFSTGTYDSNATTFVPGVAFWAAAELWEATGDPSYLAAARRYFDTFDAPIGECATLRWGAPPGCAMPTHFDWGSMVAMGTLRLALSRRPGPLLADQNAVERARGAVLAAAEAIADAAFGHPYGRTVGGLYHWGINGAIARNAITLHAARMLTANPCESQASNLPGAGPDAHSSQNATAAMARYAGAASLGLAHLLGANDYGRSYVTGAGFAPASGPHHRPSMAEHRPWPWMLVGGPWPRARDWTDDKLSYRTNEVAINWQASLVYILSMFVPAPTSSDDWTRGGGSSALRDACDQASTSRGTLAQAIRANASGHRKAPVGRAAQDGTRTLFVAPVELGICLLVACAMVAIGYYAESDNSSWQLRRLRCPANGQSVPTAVVSDGNYPPAAGAAAPAMFPMPPLGRGPRGLLTSRPDSSIPYPSTTGAAQQMI